MLAYTVILSLLCGGFLYRMQLIKVTEFKRLQDHVSAAHDVGLSALDWGTALFQLLQDVTVYILVAVVVFAVSALIWLSAVWNPARYKSFLLMVLGVGTCWVGIHLPYTAKTPATPTALEKALQRDTDRVTATVFLSVAHVYILTSVIYFLRGARNEDLWQEVREGRKLQEQDRDELRSRNFGAAMAVESYCEKNYRGRDLLHTLSEHEQRLFVVLVADRAKTTGRGFPGDQEVEYVCQHWWALKEQYSLQSF